MTDRRSSLWGLISCHTYGRYGMRPSTPVRQICRLLADSVSRNIERLSYAQRLQTRKLINTESTSANPSGYIVAKAEDLLTLFDADYGVLSIGDEAKILGALPNSQEALAVLEYLRMKAFTNIKASADLAADFDIQYPPGFEHIAGLLSVPLSHTGHDFIVFFRRGLLRQVHWAGNPYEKVINEGRGVNLEPRKSFRLWSETIVGKSKAWTDEQLETASVLCLIYSKVRRQRRRTTTDRPVHRRVAAEGVGRPDEPIDQPPPVQRQPRGPDAAQPDRQLPRGRARVAAGH